MVTGVEGEEIFWNPRFGTLFGVDTREIVQLPREEVRQLALARVVDQKAFILMIEQAYADPLMEFQDEVALKFPAQCILRRHSAPILNDDGVVIGRVWTFLDITETRRLQAESANYAQMLEERLAQQAEELKAAQEQLLEAAQMRAVGTVAVSIAHELRNIITTLRLEMASNSDTC